MMHFYSKSLHFSSLLSRVYLYRAIHVENLPPALGNPGHSHTAHHSPQLQSKPGQKKKRKKWFDRKTFRDFTFLKASRFKGCPQS